jgi:hypothetical protein
MRKKPTVAQPEHFGAAFWRQDVVPHNAQRQGSPSVSLVKPVISPGF